MSAKHPLRAELHKQRQSVSQADAEKAGELILALIIDANIDWTNVRRAHLYCSVGSLGEVSTDPLREWLTSSHPGIALVLGDAAPSSDLPKGKFDIIFTPVLGFDRDGFRLGMGGGWYDRWLADQPNAQKIGLAYAWAERAALPRESHDVPLDAVVTPVAFIHCR